MWYASAMARHLAPLHVRKKGHPEAPPIADVERWIDRSDKSGHWWWDGEFDEQRQPVLRWPPTKDGLHSIYGVVRALVFYDQHGIVPGASVVNECGYVACVHPKHWRVEDRAQRAIQRHRYQIVNAMGYEPIIIDSPWDTQGVASRLPSLRRPWPLRLLPPDPRH